MILCSSNCTYALYRVCHQSTIFQLEKTICQSALSQVPLRDSWKYACAYIWVKLTTTPWRLLAPWRLRAQHIFLSVNSCPPSRHVSLKVLDAGLIISFFSTHWARKMLSSKLTLCACNCTFLGCLLFPTPSVQTEGIFTRIVVDWKPRPPNTFVLA